MMSSAYCATATPPSPFPLSGPPCLQNPNDKSNQFNIGIRYLSGSKMIVVDRVSSQRLDCRRHSGIARQLRATLRRQPNDVGLVGVCRLPDATDMSRFSAQRFSTPYSQASAVRRGDGGCNTNALARQHHARATITSPIYHMLQPIDMWFFSVKLCQGGTNGYVTPAGGVKLDYPLIGAWYS
ncbi:hypothetical protein DAEQUDRAFT_434018 [Daedalea quercina L-15889]|uniref:Uncharacterized protein n=1 Tax=Daedalea quercina L-15889 TaxID=1314783 RepID=A0A165NH35_9APHY|nr:hypothetical protein DAEQUDRAFT_434018 [Daedalea quercina L-15889]